MAPRAQSLSLMWSAQIEGGGARDDKLGSLSSLCVIYLLRDCLSMVLVERGWLLVEMWNQMLTLAKVGSGSTNHQLYIYIYIPTAFTLGLCVCVVDYFIGFIQHLTA